MNNVIKNGREIVQYSVQEFSDLVKQTEQNIRHRARKNKFKQDGVSAHRHGHSWIIEVDVQKFLHYLGTKQ